MNQFVAGLFFWVIITGGTVAAESLPNVVVLATGGTIAGAGNSSVTASYSAAKLPIDDVLNSVPEIHQLAQVSGEQVSQIGSQAMTNQVWLTLARRVNHHLSKNGVAGVVITHGTDTMEETAYFLDLVVHSDKPVVLVGSMRPSTSLSPDGARNLFNAVALAASTEARGYGALITMNDSILSAKSVTKAHTTKTNAFVSRNNGVVGHIELGVPTFYSPAAERKTVFSVKGVKALPSVDIAYGYANASPAPISAFVEAGAKGIVYAGVGNGNLFPTVQEALKSVVKSGIVVVRSSRVGAGHVLRNAEIDDDSSGFIVADDVNPQKARVLLMLALLNTNDKEQIQQWFYQY